MPLFGRARPTTSYPETLDVTRQADVDWIRRSGDPLVWHDAVLSCLIFRGDPHGLIAWLVEQPALERVTAAAMFLHPGNGMRRLSGKDVEFVSPVHRQDEVRAQIEAMIDRLIQLDPGRVLADHGIGTAEGWESARREVIKVLADQAMPPLRFLGEPIDNQRATMPYSDIGEGELVSDAYMRREMPFLFD